jgi:integrase
MHLKELHQRTGKKPWCFPAKHKGKEHIDAKTMSKQFGDRQKSEPMKNRSKYVETLTLSGGGWTPHDLRRTAAIIMGSVGIDPLTIESCINHVMPKLTRTYQKEVAWDRKREAWDKLGQRLTIILNNPSASQTPQPQAD